MLNTVYGETRPSARPWTRAIDPTEYAAATILQAVTTLVMQVHQARSLTDLQRIEPLLKTCAIRLLEAQDVLGHREHALSGGQ